MKEQKNSIGVRKGNNRHDCDKQHSVLNRPPMLADFLVFRIGFQSLALLPCFNWVMLQGLHLLFVTDCSVSYKSLNSLGWFMAV